MLTNYQTTQSVLLLMSLFPIEPLLIYFFLLHAFYP